MQQERLNDLSNDIDCLKEEGILYRDNIEFYRTKPKSYRLYQSIYVDAYTRA